MRRLVHIFLFVTLLGFVLSGCRQSAAERQLVEIDTLIARGTYDSALAQLRAIDTTTLSRDELAYHGLLMAHAAYKAYDSAYLDTTWIARARTAYTDGGPYDRHIRTLLNSGCVANDLDDPLTAMRWYKRTELNAKSDDHFSKGYALMSMGFLYERQANSSDMAISRFIQAKDVFIKSNNKALLLTCLTELGACYRTQNTDSSIFYIDQAIQLSAKLGDLAAYYYNINDLAGLYYNENHYHLCKTYARFVADNGAHFTDSTCFFFCAISYAQLGDLDSARYFLERSREPQTIADTLLRNQAENAIETHQTYQPAVNDLMVDSLMRVSLKTELAQAEMAPAIERIRWSYSNLTKIAVALSITLMLSVLFLFLYRKKKREIIRNLIEQAEKAKEELTAQLKDASNIRQSNSNTILLKKALQTIVQDIPQRKKKDAVKNLFTPAFLQQIQQCVDQNHNNLAKKLLASDTISTRDANIACMHFCSLPNFFIMCYMNVTNEHSVTTRKKIIARKLLGEDSDINQIPQAFLS